ncbi:RNA polymerase sigma factor [Dyadobacter fanqingshengii]|uniref:Sigma-70 family RNA polymerase sigma factor n=1 Tax=Dyadobacter fanqingshengii TaxID=2906443 RepID=A0A9X1T8Y1_9BACT|nr:sigma-70 family RNA polymerase sigma factor [Dyadobacter fanqingshengii]MCF0039364.1 sigma-70 family RNA polymerase sigma factor [Dyadobacter fanqingshengii]MCF2503094.1 sigma-70 family RNA polymerase sigma factor [Dyadobacter fanqingshengii]USJ33821.1 sigma-70 family RNA polymerase sigma factor [Dyadobacter fanqingshengii]
MTARNIYTEQELTSLLKSNDRSAFEYLYDHYSPALYGIIIKIVKDEERACDTMQDTFLKIWKNIGSYNPEKGTLFTWILNIARNTAIDKLRVEIKKDKIINLESVRDRDLCSVAIFNPLPATMDLRSIVDRLLPERKLLIEMVYFQGYTHEEVSERLSLPLGTVKSRIRKALQELRHIFAVDVPEAIFA